MSARLAGLFFLARVIHGYRPTPNPTLPPVGCSNYGLCAPGAFWPDPVYKCAQCKCNAGYSGATCSLEDPSFNVCASNPCAPPFSRCERTLSGIYGCYCPTGYFGDSCEQSPCNPNPCSGGVACTPIDRVRYSCACPSGRIGPRCDIVPGCMQTAQTSDGSDQLMCNPNGQPPNQGSCIQDDPQAFNCACSSPWFGKLCLLQPNATYPTNACNDVAACNATRAICYVGTDFAAKCSNCRYGYWGSQCENELIDGCAGVDCGSFGRCEAMTNSTAFFCECENGHTGANCEQNTFCGANPGHCKNGGVCQDYPSGPVCRCYSQYSGKRCENYDLCADIACKQSTCSQTLHASLDFVIPQCSCPPYYKGLICEDDSEKVLVDTFGTENYKTIMNLVGEKNTNNARFLASMPFTIAMLSDETRRKISWSLDEFIVSAYYEDLELNRDEAFIFDMDPVMGNCYTFNSYRANFSYQRRAQGCGTHLRVRIGPTGNESLPWDEKSASAVYISSPGVAFASDGLHIMPRPGEVTVVQPIENSFNRLPQRSMFARRGACADNATDVPHFYGNGSYNVDVCLRSCSQNRVQADCGCMDPRYPMAEGARKCELKDFDCCESIFPKHGDPSAWPDCHCPQACHSTEYTNVMSRNLLRVFCPLDSPADACQSNSQAEESVITIEMSVLKHEVYSEGQSMTLPRLVAALGGYGGLICGFCIIFLFEVISLGYRLCFIREPV